MYYLRTLLIALVGLWPILSSAQSPTPTLTHVSGDDYELSWDWGTYSQQIENATGVVLEYDAPAGKLFDEQGPWNCDGGWLSTGVEGLDWSITSEIEDAGKKLVITISRLRDTIASDYGFLTSGPLVIIDDDIARRAAARDFQILKLLYQEGGKIFLDFRPEKEEQMLVEIRDLYGRPVMRQNVSTGLNRLNLVHLPKGTYLITAHHQASGTWFREKLIW